MKMNQKNMAWAAALTLAAVLSGCSQQAAASAVPDYIRVENVENNRTVTIQAAETVKTVPDMAEIVFAVNTEDADAKACQEENARKVNQVLEYLKGQGIAEASISTSDFSLEPMYDWSGDRRELIGYEMCTRLTVSDVAMDQVGTLISQTVNAGANEILSVNYFSSKYDEAYQEALAKAVAQAKTKAEAMAHAENCQISGVFSMEEYSDSQQGRYVDSGIMNRMSASSAAVEAAADMAVMAGEMSVTARVQVVYELANQ